MAWTQSRPGAAQVWLLPTALIQDRRRSWEPRIRRTTDTDLAIALSRRGLTFPIVVRRNTPEEKAESGGYAYTVVIGQRRLRAARSSKLGHVRAIFREYATEVEAYQASIVDNLAERNHLHPLDYSAALTELWSVGASVDFVKLKLELTDRRLSHHLRLANLHPGLRDLFYEGKISNSVAYTLLELTQDVQGDYARAIRNKGHEVTDPKKLRTVFRQVWRSRIEPKLLRQGRIA